MKPPSFLQQIRKRPPDLGGSVRDDRSAAARPSREFLDDACDLAAGMIGYGFGPGDRAAVVGSFSVDALYAIFATWAAGGTVVPVDRAAPLADARDALRACGVRVALAVGREDLERLIELRPDLPDLDIVLVSRSGDDGGPCPARTFRDVAASGADARLAAPGLVAGISAVPSVLVLGTSADGIGTRRRGSEDLERGASDSAAGMGIAPDDRVLVSLPLEGGVELDVARAVLSGSAELILAEGDRPGPEVYRSVRPTRAFVRRVGLETLEGAVEKEISERGWFGRALLREAFRAVGDRSRRSRWAVLADRLVLRSLGERLTGGRLRGAACPGPPPPSPRLAALGVTVRPLSGGA